MVSELAQFIDKLDSQTFETVNAIRSVISDSHPGLTESIKWNAPSFSLNGEDRITLGLERKGGVRVVLHRGAKLKELAGFSFDDSDGLAHWPTPDRGIIMFADKTDVEHHAHALSDLCSRWLAKTG